MHCYLFNELMRAVYTAWFLQQAGYGSEPIAHYKTVELAVEAALELANRSDQWMFAEDAIPSFERLLALHDLQLNVAPLYQVRAAEQRLQHSLAGTAESPIQEPCRGPASDNS
jgi:hypothetical protein